MEERAASTELLSSPHAVQLVPVATVAEPVTVHRTQHIGNPSLSGVIGAMTALVLWFAYRERQRPQRANDAGSGADADGLRHKMMEARVVDEFERLVRWLCARDGYGVRRVDATGEGSDFLLTAGDARDVVRCKRAGGTVDPATVREFYGAMLHLGARHGFIVTTSQFTASTQESTANVPITLVDGQTLVAWIDGTFSAARHASAERSFDPYLELQVARDATEQQVKGAYRSLMGQYHPDRVSHLAPEIQAFAKRKAQAINRAYDSLKRAHGWK